MVSKLVPIMEVMYFMNHLFALLALHNMGKTNVAANISFRLFGEEGYLYMEQLYKNGFKEIGQTETLNFEI